GDGSVEDVVMASGKDVARFVLFCDLAAQLDSVAYFELRIGVISESERSQSILEAEVSIEKERIFIKDFAFVAALRNFHRHGQRPTVAKQIALAELCTDNSALEGPVTNRQTEFLALR